jgi:hypothetical protein
MKEYIAHIEFETIEIRVKAKDRREANRKVKEKLARRKIKIDKNNYFLDREYY